MKWAVLSFVVLLSGCAGSLYQKVSTEKGDVRMGMTEAEVRQVLGDPDEIYQGGRTRWSTPHAADYFPAHVKVGPNGAEWVYKKREPWIIVWVESGEVIWLGTLGFGAEQ